MRLSESHDRRKEQILVELVRTYIETGQPVSSRAIARRHSEALSSATVRNVMADLEEEGYLYQPHTSAGRVPTAAAYRFFVQRLASNARPSLEDRQWIGAELSAAGTTEEFMERASHILATLSRGLGIILSPPLARTVVEHMRFLSVPGGRVLVVVISPNGATRDKLIAPQRSFSQEELDRTAEFLNHNYRGWTMEAMRADLLAHLARDRQRYDELARAALLLCVPQVLEAGMNRQVYVEGASQIATAPEFADQSHLRELLTTIEEKSRLIALLTGCVEAPEPVTIQIGVKEISHAGQNLALISAPYTLEDRGQGSLGVLGPLRMPYERAIAAVAYLAEIFNARASGVSQL